MQINIRIQGIHSQDQEEGHRQHHHHKEQKIHFLMNRFLIIERPALPAKYYALYACAFTILIFGTTLIGQEPDKPSQAVLKKLYDADTNRELYLKIAIYSVLILPPTLIYIIFVFLDRTINGRHIMLSLAIVTAMARFAGTIHIIALISTVDLTVVSFLVGWLFLKNVVLSALVMGPLLLAFSVGLGLTCLILTKWRRRHHQPQESADSNAQTFV